MHFGTTHIDPMNNRRPQSAPAEAFEVPLDDDDETGTGDASTGSSSIIKRHPPKRLLQRLVEPSYNQTIEDLEEKLANAELRRNQVDMRSIYILNLSFGHVVVYMLLTVPKATRRTHQGNG